MNEITKQLVEFIESIGFCKDIEDNIWYDKELRRISLAYFSAHTYNIFYPQASFSNGVRFYTLEEFKVITLGIK